MNMKPSRIFMLALILALLVALPVSAAGPIFITGGDDIDYPEPEGFCPGFEVRNHEIYTFRIKTWLDEEGNVLRSEAHYEGVDNLYNPANPGIVLSGHFVGSGHYDARTGKDYVTGVPYHITVPGYGTVLVRSGRWISPLYPYGHIAGKDSFVSKGDMEQLCSYLAGD